MDNSLKNMDISILIRYFCRFMQNCRTVLPDFKINELGGFILNNSIKGLQEFARSLNSDRGFTELGDKVLLLPVCQRVSDNPKYSVLFRDPALSDYILSLLYRQERDHMVRELMNYNLTEREADMLFTYLLTGAFAVNKAMGWKKDKDWMRVQQIILNFVSSGMDGLKKM